MVTKVVIKDAKKSTVGYISDLKNFKNGTEFNFNPGVNIVVGENGSGKTTLMKLIERYLMVGYMRCERGKFNSNVKRLYGYGGAMLDGVDVFADYTRNTFRLSHAGEMKGEEAMGSMSDFSRLVTQSSSSTGEGVVVALNSLFNYMFGKDAELFFDYNQFKYTAPKYYDYIKEHQSSGDEWTVLMDEPDRNLSLENIGQIKSILSFHKPQTQIIAVIHNPLLIYSLSYNKDVNFVEMSRGYVNKVRKEVDKLIKKK